MAISIRTGQFFDITHDRIDRLELHGMEVIRQNIINFFSTPWGDRGATFLPNWGSRLDYLLHEPVDEEYAQLIKLQIYEEITQSHPMLKVNAAKSRVSPIFDVESPGYYIFLVVSPNYGQGDSQQFGMDFTLSQQA